MYQVTMDNRRIEAEEGTLLAEFFIRHGILAEHPCGGKGICKKCLVRVNDRAELSCRYRIHSDITVVLPRQGEILSVTGANVCEEDRQKSENGSVNRAEKEDVFGAACADKTVCLVLDIGTTTLALAAVSTEEKKVIRVLTSTNPQRVFGADVISRIGYCREHSVEELQEVLVSEGNRLILQMGVRNVDKLFVAGNVTMLHTLFGEDCSSLGVAPYQPVFLEGRETTGVELGISGVKRVISLPAISTFVGADVVAGMNYVGLPPREKYNLLVDLGTNAEIVLFSRDIVLCTAAAAGPCFEGANISCGMSATPGAVTKAFWQADGTLQFETIGMMVAKGICGTGLIDLIAMLREKRIIDETGYMECEEYSLTEHVALTQDDVRQYQLAKSAVCSAIRCLMEKQKISYDQIGKVYLSGGFSSEINLSNAVKTGLLPKELLDRCETINNSSLLGTIKFACEGNDLSGYSEKAEYVDLASDAYFAKLFMENMEFPTE